MLDFIGETLAYLFFNFIGGTIRWVYGSVWRTLFNKPKFTYGEYLYGPKKPDYYDEHAHGCVNSIIGIVFCIALISLLSIFI